MKTSSQETEVKTCFAIKNVSSPGLKSLTCCRETARALPAQSWVTGSISQSVEQWCHLEVLGPKFDFFFVGFIGQKHNIGFIVLKMYLKV